MDVVDKLVVDPEVTLTLDSRFLTSISATLLTYNLGRDDEGLLVCSACVTVPDADIDFCNQSSVEFKRIGII